MACYQITDYVFGLRQPPPGPAYHQLPESMKQTPDTLDFYDEQWSRDPNVWRDDVVRVAAGNNEMARTVYQEFAGPRRSHPTSGGTVGMYAQFANVEEYDYPRDLSINNDGPQGGWEPWMRPLEEGAVRLNGRPIEVTMEAGGS